MALHYYFIFLLRSTGHLPELKMEVVTQNARGVLVLSLKLTGSRRNLCEVFGRTLARCTRGLFNF